MTTDRLLTEVERQRKYLDKLPQNFEFPLFNAKQALESQRRSGYRNTASAAREIVDNAIEAGADKIHVIFDKPKAKDLKAHERKNSVSAVAFIDNGSGMIPQMARYALSWGAGTHFDDPGFIGRFGFGLPNASINQTRLVEVYTKTADAAEITKAHLSIGEFADHGVQTIPPPQTPAVLPDFVQAYLDRHGMGFDHGTVVVWVRPDRLSARGDATLREHLVDDFGVTYRYLLDDLELVVADTRVQPIDPLFLDPKGLWYVPTDQGGAELSREWNIPVKYFRDPDTGGLHLAKVKDPTELDPADENLLATGTIHVRVSRFPKGFAQESKGGMEHSQKRFEIRKSRRGMSFVRAKREIETVDVFPKSSKEASKGLGNWPMLQSYAYYWGVEVRFDPDFDDVFGITNDKQTVRPIEDFWRVMVEAEVDAQLQLEGRHQTTIRAKKPAPAEPSPEPTPAELAAAKAEAMLGQRPTVADRDKPKAREDLETEAKKRVGVSADSIEQAVKAIEEEAKRRPFRVDFYDDPNGPMYKPEWGHGSHVVVRINREHQFFKTLYSGLLQTSDGGAARQALDLVLITLARAELTSKNEESAMWYEVQRERVWSPFLHDALRLLQQSLLPEDEEGVEAEARAAEAALEPAE